MKRWLAVLSVCSALGATTAAYAKGPEVDLVDNKLSINAEAIPLSRLLQMVDRATGMKSKVPPELANRNVTVRFSNLTMTDAVRKMFQGQPVDYVLIQGQGIIITSASQTGGEAAVSGGAYTQASAPPVDQPFTQEFPPAPGAIQQQPMPQQLPQGQPAMVQTPFGPVPNPRAQQQQQPNTPLNAPGQQNSLFPTVGNPAPGPAPTLQPGNPNPFGTTSPFGTPNQPANQNNSLFGNPQTFGGPGQR